MAKDENKIKFEVSLWLEENEANVLKRWLELIRESIKIWNEKEIQVINNIFFKLLNSVATYLRANNINEYDSRNLLIARELAMTSLTYKQFVGVFQLFKESYMPLLFEQENYERIRCFVKITDALHNHLISSVTEEYFNINDSTVATLVKLTELRDNSTGHHLERTRDYSVLLAREFGLDENVIFYLSKASLLHDIGKVGIRDSILLKPGKLSFEEFNEIKKHTTIGADSIDNIIASQKINIPYLYMAKEIALYHHERYDGQGYPCGLQGEEIPLAARIFAIADSYDTIVSPRPYKPALSHEEATLRIAWDSGKQFDPKIVEVFLRNQDKFNEINSMYNIRTA